MNYNNIVHYDLGEINLNNFQEEDFKRKLFKKFQFFDIIEELINKILLY